MTGATACSTDGTALGRGLKQVDAILSKEGNKILKCDHKAIVSLSEILHDDASRQRTKSSQPTKRVQNERPCPVAQELFACVTKFQKELKEVKEISGEIVQFYGACIRWLVVEVPAAVVPSSWPCAVYSALKSIFQNQQYDVALDCALDLQERWFEAIAVEGRKSCKECVMPQFKSIVIGTLIIAVSSLNASLGIYARKSMSFDVDRLVDGVSFAYNMLKEDLCTIRRDKKEDIEIEQHAITIVKSLYKCVLALLSMEKTLEALKLCQVALSHSPHPTTLPKCLKMVASVVPHGDACMVEAIQCSLDALDDSLCTTDSYSGDLNTLLDAQEECLAALRRLVLQWYNSTPDASVSTLEMQMEDRMRSVRVIVDCIGNIYRGRQSRSLHQGVTALAAAAFLLSGVEEGDSSIWCSSWMDRSPLDDAVRSILRISDSTEWFNLGQLAKETFHEEDAKDLIWLSSTLYNIGIKPSSDSCLKACNLCLWASIQVAMCFNFLLKSGVIEGGPIDLLKRHHALQQSCLESGNQEFASVVTLKVVACLKQSCIPIEDTDYTNEMASQLLAQFVKASWKANLGGANPHPSILDTSLKQLKKKTVNLDFCKWIAMQEIRAWALVIKNQMTNNADQAPHGLNKHVHHIVSVALFDLCPPGKTPEDHIEMLLAFWKCIGSLESAMSVDSLLECSLDSLESTKTKIGKKRIEVTLSILELLKNLEIVIKLVQTGLKYHESLIDAQRSKISADPTLVHSNNNNESLEQRMIFWLKSNLSQWSDVVENVRESFARSKNHLKKQTDFCVGVERLLEAHDLLPKGPIAESLLGPVFRDTEVGALQKMLDNMQLRENNSGENLHKGSRLLSQSLTNACQGNHNAALQNVIECHKVLRTAFEKSTYDTYTWWSSLPAYLGCLSVMVMLFETSGMYEEAMHAAQEGLRLTSILCTPLASLYFALQTCQLYKNAANPKFQQMLCNCMLMKEICGDRLVESELGSHLLAHLECLLAYSDRVALQFSTALIHIHRVPDILHNQEALSMYNLSIVCYGHLERLHLLIDQESRLETLVNAVESVLEDIEKMVEGVHSDTSMEGTAAMNPLIGGVSYAMILLIAAQLQAKSIWHISGTRVGLWMRRKDLDLHSIEGIFKKIWGFYQILASSPHIQRVLSMILARLAGILGHLHLAATLLHLSSHSTLCHQYRLLIFSRQNQGSRNTTGDECSDQKSIDRFFEFSPRHAELDSLEAQAAGMIHNWIDQMEEDIVTVGIASYSAPIYGKVVKAHDRLVLYRLQGTRSPVILEIPILEDEENHPIQTLQISKAIGVMQAVSDDLNQILKDSNANMKSLGPNPSDSEQQLWWQQRIALDQNLGNLLLNIRKKWIDPWTMLLSTSDTMVTEVSDVSNASLLELIGLKNKFVSANPEHIAIINQTVRDAMINIGNQDMDVHLDLENSWMHLSQFDRKELLHFNHGVLGMHERTKITENNLLRSPEGASRLRSRNTGIINGNSAEILSDCPDQPEKETPLQSKSCQAVTGLSSQDQVGSLKLSPKKRKHKSRLARLHTLSTTPGTCRTALASSNTITSEAVQRKSERPSVLPKFDSRTNTPAKPRTCHLSSFSTQTSRVLLIVDHVLQNIPWEVLLNLETGEDQTGFVCSRLPSLPVVAHMKRKGSIALDSCFFALNPSGDLQNTEKTFAKWFQDIPGWDGVIGKPPKSTELLQALKARELFVYCGHGAGEQYLSIPKIRSLNSCASALLMGCSSGKLRWNANGIFEPAGVLLAYILAGCPLAIANLWDVTDKDIDRYCGTLLNDWLSHEPGKNAELAVQTARAACKLPFLIGAAPVCFGMPTTALTKSTMQ